MQCKLIVTSLLCNGTSHCAMVRSYALSAPIGLYTTSVLDVVQSDMTTYEALVPQASS